MGCWRQLNMLYKLLRVFSSYMYIIACIWHFHLTNLQIPAQEMLNIYVFFLRRKKAQRNCVFYFLCAIVKEMLNIYKCTIPTQFLRKHLQMYTSIFPEKKQKTIVCFTSCVLYVVEEILSKPFLQVCCTYRGDRGNIVYVTFNFLHVVPE